MSEKIAAPPADVLLTELRNRRRMAAPSWVLPAGIPENCRFLAGRVDEAGLLFFEAEACLAYGKKELPADLAVLPLSYHIHLPLDLPWHTPEASADTCASLLGSCAFLAGDPEARLLRSAVLSNNIRPLDAVLHPPDTFTDASELMRRFVARFIDLGIDPSCLLLENTPENDLCALEDLVLETGMHICMDLGHMAACGQERLLTRQALLERTRLLHLSAPLIVGSSIRHGSLGRLKPEHAALGQRLCRSVPASATVMLEVFAWNDFKQSLPVLQSWLLPGM